MHTCGRIFLTPESFSTLPTQATLRHRQLDDQEQEQERILPSDSSQHMIPKDVSRTTRENAHDILSQMPGRHLASTQKRVISVTSVDANVRWPNPGCPLTNDTMTFHSSTTTTKTFFDGQFANTTTSSYLNLHLTTWNCSSESADAYSTDFRTSSNKSLVAVDKMLDSASYRLSTNGTDSLIKCFSQTCEPLGDLKEFCYYSRCVFDSQTKRIPITFAARWEGNKVLTNTTSPFTYQNGNDYYTQVTKRVKRSASVNISLSTGRGPFTFPATAKFTGTLGHRCDTIINYFL